MKSLGSLSRHCRPLGHLKYIFWTLPACLEGRQRLSLRGRTEGEGQVRGGPPHPTNAKAFPKGTELEAQPPSRRVGGSVCTPCAGISARPKRAGAVQKQPRAWGWCGLDSAPTSGGSSGLRLPLRGWPRSSGAQRLNTLKQ